MKKSLAAVLTITLAIFAMQSIQITAAHACSPGESHYNSITADDTPDCLQIDAYAHWHGSITLRNECDEIVELESTSCEACDSQASIEPGAEAYELIIDARGSDELEDGQITKQSYTWTLGDQAGTLETEVRYNDISGHCSGFGGCSSTGSSAPVGSIPLLFLFGLILFFRSYGALAISR